jgi:peptidoglycan/LPS O-acetylase OafA/YrhL
MLYHYCFQSNSPFDNTALSYPELSGFVQYGFMGVDFFFVISGFVICMSAEKGDLNKFIVSRLLRLYPAYVVCVIFTALVAVCFSAKSVSFFQFLINITMFQEFLRVPHIDAVYWTLSFELVFYFWIGVAIFTGLIKKIELLVIPFVIVSFAATLWAEPVLVKALFISPWAHYFVAGVIFYKLYKEGWSTYRFMALLICYGVSALNVLELARNMTAYHSVDFSAKVMFSQVTIIYLVMFLAALGAYDNIKVRWFRAAGAITFPLYLLHGLIGNVILSQFSDLSRWFGLLVTIMIVITLSIAVSQYIEPLIVSRIRQPLHAVANEISRRFLLRFKTI